jgi:hypothetical protein
MEIDVLPEAGDELLDLRRRDLAEYTALLQALRYLKLRGITLSYPWTSQVKGTDLRELRPRRGRSRWRAFYRRDGDLLRIGAIGPEANIDKRGFEAAVHRASNRLQRRS